MILRGKYNWSVKVRKEFAYLWLSRAEVCPSRLTDRVFRFSLTEKLIVCRWVIEFLLVLYIILYLSSETSLLTHTAKVYYVRAILLSYCVETTVNHCSAMTTFAARLPFLVLCARTVRTVYFLRAGDANWWRRWLKAARSARKFGKVGSF